MSLLLSQLLPLLYGICFIFLLIQAFRVMATGFKAIPRNQDKASVRSPSTGDRTGRLTVHPELIDASGQLTQEDLLTIRFNGDNEQPASAGDSS